MKPGTQIAYIPTHVSEDPRTDVRPLSEILQHPDVELGFITSERGDAHFCRYWRKGKELGLLRTVANSELTPTSMLIEYESVTQMLVDGIMRGLFNGPANP